MHRETARSGVTPWPTRMGSAVITAAIVMKLMSTRGTIALGAIIALAVLMVVDYLLSMLALYRRPVNASVARTRVVAPDTFQVAFEAPRGMGHLHILAARFTLFADDSEFCTLASHETTQTIALPAEAWNSERHIRFRSDLSIMGLVSARRWTTQVVPELCLVPEPVNQTADLVGTDDVGRLREYVPGDRMATVSWGATARTGQLHVRAGEPEPEELVVVVDLGNDANTLSLDGHGVDHTVSVALGLCEDLLSQGHTFRLTCAEVIPAVRSKTHEMALASPWRRPRPKLEHRPGEASEWLYEGKLPYRVSSSTIYDHDELVRRLAAIDLSAPIPRPAGHYIEVTRAGVRSVS